MWREFWVHYGKRTIGAAAGLFFGFVYLFAGFWDMLVFMLLISVGYWIGKKKDLRQDPAAPWQQVWSVLMERFRPFR
ncbi:DUF2273 domain-containing protein [Paenibacillus sp. Leaf72]|uniref:DUF2273 domain-containing protein n=1 Tax=Paenibacillus sp. Leaf72 TaxID=1736234 RepID=UPI0006F46600|nr:DUF2273 domain-containing protein [Paenibacillus sp. Leaf72]KQO17499.1 hypothetical protein ASF12_02080 [Paenibacillus sp. Leaf72]